MKAIETNFIKKNLKIGSFIKVYGMGGFFHFDIILSLKPFIIFCMNEKNIKKSLNPDRLYKINDCRIIEYETFL